jgi:hypothetical protein
MNETRFETAGRDSGEAELPTVCFRRGISKLGPGAHACCAAVGCWRQPSAVAVAVTVAVRRQWICISRAAAYRFASAGDLPTKRLGRRVYVVSAKLREFIEKEDEAA